MLSAATSAKSYSFSEFFFSSVIFFTVSAVITLMMQDHTADRSLQFLMKWSLFLQCMHSCFVQHSVTFFSDTHCSLCLSSVSVTVTMMCSVSSQFMLSVWDCCVMMLNFTPHAGSFDVSNFVMKFIVIDSHGVFGVSSCVTHHIFYLFEFCFCSMNCIWWCTQWFNL